LNNFLEKLHKPSRTDCLIFILLGVLVLIIAVPTGSEEQKTVSEVDSGEEVEYPDSVQEQLAAVLSKMEGVGQVRVMISFSDEKQLQVEGVVVVAEGGDSPQVETRIRDAVMSLFDVEAHKVIVVKMSGQEE
jgi:stage III sporulation protein AG